MKTAQITETEETEFPMKSIDTGTAFKMLDQAKDILLAGSENPSIWLYCLNQTPGGEVGGASRFELPPLGEGFRKKYFEALSKSIRHKRKYEDVVRYDGNVHEKALYWLPGDDKKVANAWEKLQSALGRIEPGWLKETDDGDRQASSPSFNGVGITCESNGKEAWFLMARPPVKTLSYAIRLFGDKMREIKQPIVTMPLQVDAIFIGETLFFLTGKVLEQLWSQEEEKKQARAAIDTITSADVLDNPGAFKEWAEDESNARRLLSFNEEKLTQIQSGKHWDVCRKFGLEATRGKLSIRDKKDAAKLVKLLSNRGMLDPFSKDGMEVSGAKKWR
jgi:hypothetical protein